MASKDYNDYLVENMVETETMCSECGKDATMKYIKIVEVKPEIVMNVFECLHCNIKDTSVYNAEEDDSKPIKIVCNFDSKEDMKREINLNKNTHLTIIYEDVEYTFESSLPNVYNVEGIIHQAVENLTEESNVFGLDSSKEELGNVVLKLQNIIDKTPPFKIFVEDPKGLTRISPIGRGLFEMQGQQLDAYNDEKVTHSYV